MVVQMAGSSKARGTKDVPKSKKEASKTKKGKGKGKGKAEVSPEGKGPYKPNPESKSPALLKKPKKKQQRVICLVLTPLSLER